MRKTFLLPLALLALLATWWPSPAAAQLNPICPTFESLELTPQEEVTFSGGGPTFGTELRIGQASNGIVVTQIGATTFNPGDALPQWPQYVQSGFSVTVKNTASLIRAVYYCYVSIPTATPTRTATGTATATPTATGTVTPTATPNPAAGPCYSGNSQLLTDQFGNDWKAVLPVPPFLDQGGQYYKPASGNWTGWRIRFRELNGTTSTATVRISDGIAGIEEVQKNNTFYALTSGTTGAIFYTIEPGTAFAFQWELCDPSVFGPATATPTPSNTRTATATPLPTSTGTLTPTPTPTITPTPTLGSLGCVGTEYRVPVAPNAIEIPLNTGTRLIVADATIYINLPTVAQPIYPGAQTWSGPSGVYVAYTVTVSARVVVCISEPATPIPTFVNTPTPAGTPNIGGPPPCIAVQPTPTTIAFSMPDLSLVLPTLRPLGSPTPTGTVTTIAISTTAVVGFFETVQAGISTPAASVATISAGYSWESGAQLAATTVSWSQPALDWLAIANPQAAAWQTAGGPLWALAPLLLPVLPILAFILVVVLIRFLLWLVGWFLKLVDLIIKLIELIPGM